MALFRALLFACLGWCVMAQVEDPCTSANTVTLSESTWNIANTAAHTLKPSDLNHNWFTFSGDAGVKIAERCIKQTGLKNCGNSIQMFLQGRMPTYEEGIIQGVFCSGTYEAPGDDYLCCDETSNSFAIVVNLRTCSDGRAMYQAAYTPEPFSSSEPVTFCTVTEAQAQDDSLYYDGWIDDISGETGDPCLGYTNHTNPTRNVNTAGNDCTTKDELYMQGGTWIRVAGSAGKALAHQVVPSGNCASKSGWMPNPHPTFAEGTVVRTFCFTSGSRDQKCRLSVPLHVKACAVNNEKFYVYRLPNRLLPKAQTGCQTGNYGYCGTDDQPAELFVTTPAPTTTAAATTTTTAEVTTTAAATTTSGTTTTTLDPNAPLYSRMYKNGGICQSSIKVTATTFHDCAMESLMRKGLSFAHQGPDCYINDPSLSASPVVGDIPCYSYP